MTISENQFKELMDELKIMFSKDNYSGTVDIQRANNPGNGENKALVTITTKFFIYDPHKLNKYLYGAFLKCDNYSLDAKEDTLIMTFGFLL